jgi:hypothetical protein
MRSRNSTLMSLVTFWRARFNVIGMRAFGRTLLKYRGRDSRDLPLA